MWGYFAGGGWEITKLLGKTVKGRRESFRLGDYLRQAK